MESTSQHHNDGTAIDRLISGLLAHLDAQEAAMIAFRSLLTDLAKTSLSQMEQRRLRERLEASEQLAQRLDADRLRLLRDAAVKLGIAAEQINLSTLMRFGSAEQREAISSTRRRMRRLTTQIQRQSSTVNWIMSEERQINFLKYQCLTGATDSDRYDARGQRTVHPTSMRYQVRS
jgi:hypothetical protein